MKQIRPQLTTTGKTVIDQPAEKGAKSKASDAGKSTKSSESKKSESAKTESPKADATKAERAKEKTAEKSKSAEKSNPCGFYPITPPGLVCSGGVVFSPRAMTMR